MRLKDYDTTRPLSATVVSSTRITPEKSETELRHIDLAVNDVEFGYQVGQSVGVLVPGPHEFGQKEYLRLYSIAGGSRRDDFKPVISLCVKRCFYIDEFNGQRYDGRASNYLCDLKAGDTVTLVGPYSLAFTLPTERDANLLMIGLGTGIAPFRAFVKHIYSELGGWKGKVRLYHGAMRGIGDPEEERVRIIGTWLDNLDILNHHCFRGEARFRPGFRALVAGGGTGDGSVFLAHQLRDTDAEVEHVATALPAVGKRREALDHLDGHLHGCGRRIVDRHRVIEEHHHAVASESLQGAVVLTQPLYTGGRTLAALRLTQTQQESSRRDLSTSRQTVLVGVAEAYYAVLRAQKTVIVSKDAVDRMLRHRQVTEREASTRRTKANASALLRANSLVDQAAGGAAVGAAGAVVGTVTGWQALVTPPIDASPAPIAVALRKSRREYFLALLLIGFPPVYPAV